MFAWCIRLSRHLPGNFCLGALLCWRLKPFLDVTLLCFRDLPVPTMSGVGNLWVLYCLASCQIVSWLHGDWSGGGEFWIKCRRSREEALQCLMRILTVCFFCCVSHLFAVSCSLPCWPTGNAWVTGDEGEENSHSASKLSQQKHNDDTMWNVRNRKRIFHPEDFDDGQFLQFACYTRQLRNMSSVSAQYWDAKLC